ncbi:hypothetical protein ACJMK2_022357 [Sinanodonta woodiana]|uniref:Spondin-like TSP1 domain-containing protein n=1 Tax=Sinanodonta woodiana TaxID=1069815 RepID=A0ABD3TJS3_SINWO
MSSLKYVWTKRRKWQRECINNVCGRGGIQNRFAWCGEKGSITSPAITRSCFKVCDEHRNKLRWVSYPWSECKLNSSNEICSRKGGLQHRDVVCVWKETGLPENEMACSFFESKPVTEQVCELKCPQDCVVSKFTPWSKCDNCIRVNSTRLRSILVPPANGGAECPLFSEMSPCLNCSDSYTYKIDPFGTCIPFGDQNIKKIHPLIGYQRRTIECLHSYGPSVNLRYCTDSIRILDTNILTTIQTCIIPQDCIVSQWSVWKPINSSCIDHLSNKRPGYMTKTRSVLQIPMGTGKPCPELVNQIEVQGTAHTPCPRARWITSNWGECEASSGSYQCQAGLLTRSAICVEGEDDGHLKPVPESKCPTERPLTSQVCSAQCKIDCTVSQWTAWSECKVTDCELYVRRRRTNEGTGQRYRTREVLTPQEVTGEPCPHLSETQTCDPQPCYQWNVTVGSCALLIPNNPRQCGLGQAFRTIACINKINHRVADSLCQELVERPIGKEDCNIPCPNDCVLSQWSLWTECPNLCQEGNNQSASRTRYRTILARSSQDGAPCPPNRLLQEKEQCPTSIQCAVYVWQTDPWEELCELTDKKKRCGNGVMKRHVNCYNKQGHVANDQRCTLDVKPAETKNCTVPCPVNCKHTEYSDWSPCTTSCWEAKQVVPVQTRQRFIIQQAQYGGIPCPDKLTEAQQCTDLPLCYGYYWDTEEWSDCILPPRVPNCGKGLQARNVTCKSENGTSVSFNLCIHHNGLIPLISKPCYKSCDDVCLFTEWSQWSLCVHGCTGTRFRTRTLIVDPKKSVPSRCRNPMLYPKDEFERCLCDVPHPVPVGNWSECILEMSDDPSYFKGIRSFQAYEEEVCIIPCPVDCVMSDWSRWSDCSTSYHNMCEKFIGPFHEPLVATCQVPCDTDCLLTHWTSWTECSHTCGLGTSSRTRAIVQEPQGNGRACPTSLKQNKPCLNQGCYFWVVSPWSECTSEVGVCGYGVQTRNVTCVASSGLPVNSSRCPPDLNVAVTQSRSRAILLYPIASSTPCPDQLWESKPCTASRCYTFDWKVTPWNIENSRSVACMRSDGLEVTVNTYPNDYRNCDELYPLIINSSCLKPLDLGSTNVWQFVLTSSLVTSPVHSSHSIHIGPQTVLPYNSSKGENPKLSCSTSRYAKRTAFK